MKYLDEVGFSHFWQKNKALLEAAQRAVSAKQDKLIGTAGQVVGFDEEGNAVAQDLPSGGSMLSAIRVTVPPDKTDYYAGESFDPTGMVVTGYYKIGVVTLDGPVTGYTVSPAGAMPAGTEKVVITYSEGTVVKTCEQTVSVVKRTVAVPTQSGSLTYSGQPQTPVWTGYDSSIMTKTDIPRVDVGSSSTTFALKNPDLYQWIGGTTADQNVTWSIAKAVGSLTVNPTSIALNKIATTGEFTIGGNFDGTYTVWSEDTYVAIVALKSGKTYTVSSPNRKGGATNIKITCSGGANYTVPAGKSVSVTANFISIYGVEWDWTSSGPTRGVRTDDAAGFPDPNPAVNNGTGSSPFDDLMPWRGMVKETRAAGVMVKEPKYWFKWTRTVSGSGIKLKLQIADGPVEGFHVDPVNMDRGDGLGEVDFSYIGRHHCGSDWKSTAGVAPRVDTYRHIARDEIHSLGANIWQFDFAQYWYVNMLLLVEFTDWNGERIGRGCSASGSIENTGKTDAMTYHTGTTAANRDTYGYIQYRNIEGWWDTVGDWMDGCYYSNCFLSVIINPNQFDDHENGVPLDTPKSGYPSDFVIPTQSGLEWALYPSAVSGSMTTYVPDKWVNQYDHREALFHGGTSDHNQAYGPFFTNARSWADHFGYIGCRLWERPPKTS